MKRKSPAVWLVARLSAVLHVTPDPDQHALDCGHDCAKCHQGMSLNDDSEWGTEGTDICDSCTYAMLDAVRALVRAHAARKKESK
jgi:hypothetical protein